MQSANMDLVKDMPNKKSFLSKKRATARSELIELSPIEDKGWAKFVNVMKIVNDEELFPKGEAQIFDSFERSARDKESLQIVKETIGKCKIVSETKVTLEIGLQFVLPAERQEAFDEAKKLLDSTGCKLKILGAIPDLRRLYNQLAIEVYGCNSNNRLAMSQIELVKVYIQQPAEVRADMRGLLETLILPQVSESALAAIDQRHQTTGRVLTSQGPHPPTLTAAMPPALVDQRSVEPRRTAVTQILHRPALPLPLCRDDDRDDIKVNLEDDVAQAVGGSKQFQELFERHLGHLVDLSETKGLGQYLLKLANHYDIPSDLWNDLWYIDKCENDICEKESNYLEDPQYHYDVMDRVLRCLNPNARILHKPSRIERSLRHKKSLLEDERKALQAEREMLVAKREALLTERKELMDSNRSPSHYSERDNYRHYDKCSRDEYDSEDATKRENNRRRSRDERDLECGDKYDKHRRYSRDERDRESPDNKRRRYH